MRANATADRDRLQRVAERAYRRIPFRCSSRAYSRAGAGVLVFSKETEDLEAGGLWADLVERFARRVATDMGSG